MGPNQTAIATLDELDELLRVGDLAAKERGETARYDLLLPYYLKGPIVPEMPTDPFSAAYIQAILSFHALLSGRNNYDPRLHERNGLDIIDPARSAMYRAGNTQVLGQYVEAFGQIMRVLDLRAESHVVEFGPGEGQLALMLARAGLDVTVIDLEPRYLASIAEQAGATDTRIRCIESEFLGDYETAPADAILFFESFHHVLAHCELLGRLRSMIKPGGRVIFAGEPILPPDSVWLDYVPYPWGLRLGAFALWRIRSQGWMELGFRERYFHDALVRSGFSMEKMTSPTNGRGTCYVAKVR